MKIELTAEERKHLLSSVTTPDSIVAKLRDAEESLADTTDNWYRKAAKKRSKDGELEVDDDAIVSRGDDPGA